MIVHCTNCNAAFSVADEKVNGKKFGFSCPSCHTNVVIDNRAPVAEAPIEENTFSLPASSPASEFSETDDLQNFGLGEETSEAESSSDNDIFPSPEPETFGGITPDEDENSGIAPITDEEETEEDIGADFDSLDFLEKPSTNIQTEEPEDEEFDSKLLAEFEAGLPEVNSVSDGAVEFEDYSPEDETTIDEMDLPLPGAIDSLEVEEKPEDTNLDFEPLEEDFSENSSMVPEDESTTIDLNSLDIQLDDSNTSSNIDDFSDLEEISSEQPTISNEPENDELFFQPKQSVAKEIDDDSTTLDLNSLDISLEKSNEIMGGDQLEDERLSLNDAGISLDELSTDFPVEDEDDDDDKLHLSIDEVVPGLSLDELGEEIAEEEDQDDLDLGIEENSFTGNDSEDLLTSKFRGKSLPEMDLDKLEKDDSFLQPELDTLDNIREKDSVPQGCINFSIDYSLSYSRIGAFIRLMIFLISTASLVFAIKPLPIMWINYVIWGLFALTMTILIPHILVLFLYQTVSSILGFVNWIIILFSGSCEEDYLKMQEKTIRYSASLNMFITGAVEGWPPFAGNENIDYPLQLDATYPAQHSRLKAFLRLTYIGIFLSVLPQIIISLIFIPGVILVTFIGLFSALFKKRWPTALFDFIVRYHRYLVNIIAYVTGVVDKYPTIIL